HAASRSADRATNRREAADFEVPSPVMTGRSPSGSRTARRSLRVDTLISIKFIAQARNLAVECLAVRQGRTNPDARHGAQDDWRSDLRGRCLLLSTSAIW